MCWTQICTKSLIRVLVLFGIRTESVHFDLMDVISSLIFINKYYQISVGFRIHSMVSLDRK